MEHFIATPDPDANSLGIALVLSSTTPLLLLDDQLVVRAASASFCTAFELDPDTVVGRSLFELGDGEWDIRQLRTLLHATASGADVDSYETDLRRPGKPPRCLVLNAHLLDYGAAADVAVRIVLAVADVTDAREATRVTDNLVREKDLLARELEHRIANSLQIIASVLMQSARRVQSEESKRHLRDAHHRVMSIATLQRQLAETHLGVVILRPYLTDLCASIGASMIPDAAVIKLTVDVDGSSTSAETSVSLGLVVTELVINALKHAFPDGRPGRIGISYLSDGQNWTLTVRDDGVGMDPAIKETKPGLGTGIVEALAGQLKAEVTTTSIGPGTSVTLAHRI